MTFTRIGGGKNVVGYCKLHHHTLTTNQMKGRKCLTKGCFHFKKNLSHPIWKQREAAKKIKKRRKNGGR